MSRTVVLSNGDKISSAPLPGMMNAPRFAEGESGKRYKIERFGAYGETHVYQRVAGYYPDSLMWEYLCDITPVQSNALAGIWYADYADRWSPIAGQES